MAAKRQIFIGTVCLDRNRWGSREPSLRVSSWLPRFSSDGFDGVELWEFHYLRADDDERARLLAQAPAVAIYSSYVGFGDEDAEDRVTAARAIAELGAVGVKYNLGNEADRLAEYRRNLLAWVEQLPESCCLLCECHPWTVLERLEDAAPFFSDLDPVRFGVIAHVSGDPNEVGACFAAFGSRIRHLHLQLKAPDTDSSVPENRERLAASFDVIRGAGFDGSASIEFTRGIGRDEDMEELYRNACKDLAYCREQLSDTGGR